MALTDRDIIITPNRGAAVEPKIAFTGADSVSSGTITLKVLNSGTIGILSFEGNSGQLLSIADTMSGTIFSANDISGIPSIEVLDTGMVKLAQYNGTVVIGTGTNATGKLQIYGNTWSNSAGGDLVVRNSNSVGSAITMMPTNSANFSAGWSLYAGASGASIGDGAVGLWNHTTSAARLYVNQAGNLIVTGSVSGTQFYDSTNSAFYLFPTGNSRLRGISSLGSELASGHDPYGLISVTRGTADNYAYFGLTRSGAVGMGIGIDTSNNLWFGGTTGGHNGTRNSTYFYSDTSGNVVANTSFQAPIFRDSSDPTNYYVDPAGTSRIRKTNLIASGSGWDDGLNLYSSDATNRWNLLVDDGAADSFRIAYNNSEALNINTSRNVTAAVDFRAPIFYDNNTAYYFNGDGTTNLLNLTVNGTLSVSNFSSNLISLGAQRQYYLGNLGASATQAKRYEVARLFVDVANWHDSGVMLVELQSQYYAGGDYQLWSVNYDYGGATGNPTCRLIAGDSPRGRNAQVTISAPVQISGNYYYISVYVDVRYYSSYYTFVKTTQTSNSNATAASSGASWVFTSPAAGTNIADFTPSTTVTTNNTLQSTADMRAPIFYDNDNTGYYIDPTGTSNFNEVQFQNGKWYTSNNTSGNSTNMYIRPDGNNTYVWRMIFGGSGTGHGTGAGGFGIYNDTLGGDYSAIFPSSGYAVFPYSVRSPIYYDYTDTGYYVDPNSRSALYTWKTANSNELNWIGNSVSTSNMLGIGFNESDINYAIYKPAGAWTQHLNINFWTGIRFRTNPGYDYGASFWHTDGTLQMTVGQGDNNVRVTQDLYVGGTNNSSNIYMMDNDEGVRRIHNNSNRIGFLNSSNGWGAYCADNGDWTTDTIGYAGASFRAPIFYDTNDTGYYLDPNGTSNLYRGYFAQLMKRNNRFSNGDRYPLGHYSDGDMVWNIDPSWSEYELQEYFGSSNVTWVADSTAPGGYAIQIAGGTNVFTNGSGSGFPMIPIDSADDVFYMEVWMKGISGTANHYMGSVDFNESFGNLGGNPGSYGYWVLVGNVPGTSWSKWYGYIGGFGSAYGTFKPGAKYWSPMALFNYSGGTSYMSGWKVLRVNRQTSMIINTPNGSSSTGSDNSRAQTLTIKRSNTSQLNLGSYPGAWTSALQIQNNDASAWLWMSPLTGNTPTIATNYGAINYYTTAQNSGFAGSMNNGSFRSPIFYDSDDTGYYLDANSAAENALRVRGGIHISVGNGTGLGIILADDGDIVDLNDGYAALRFSSGVRIHSANRGGSPVITLGSNGIGTANSSWRAPIFYDTDDTSYYVDPHSTSYQRSLFLGAHDSGASEFRFGEDSSGWYGDRWYWDSSYTTYRYSRFAGTDSLIHYHDTRDTTRITYGRNIVFDNYGKGIIGTYSASRYQGVFAMGDAYKLPADGSGVSNLYGLAWSHPNAGGIAGNLADHGLLLLQNGVFKGAWGGGSLRTPGDVRGTLFYDWNDTSYYCDPNSESNLFKPTYYTQQNWSVSYRAVGRSRITGDSNYWTNTVGWGQDYGNWSNYWKYGFGGFDCWGTSTDHPQGSGYVHAQGIQSGLHNANSDGSTGYGWQMVGAADATANRYWARGKWGGSTSAWKEFAMYGGNIASSMYASIYYDADNTGYYGDFASTSNINAMQTAGQVVIGGTFSTTGYNGPTSARLMFSGGDGDAQGNYYIGTNLENYGGNYNKLDIRWHTGIRMGAQPGYGGIRFYDTEDLGTQIFAIGKDGSYAQANQSMRAPIFYDNDDTGYYADLNSTSDSAVRQRGGTLHGPNISWGKYLYVGGNGRVGTSASVAVTNGNLHLDSENGYILYLNNYSGQPVYSTTIYDLNNTAYFLDPNSRSRLSSIDYGDGGYYFAGGDWGYRHNTPYGWIQFGPANASWAHIYTDRPNFYFNKDLYVNDRWVIQENYTQNGKYLGSDGSIRANIFYDQEDTGYYANMASRRTTNINGFTDRTKMTLGLTYKYGLDRADYTGDTNYWIGSMGWGTQDLGDIFMWGSGFWDSWSNPGNQPSGTSHWTGLTSQHYNQGSYGYGWQLTMGAGDPGLFYVRGMWGAKNNTWYKVAIYDYNSNAARPFYASVYYDSNDTGYYADPNSTSVFYRLNINNNVYFTNYGRGIVGTYSASRYQAVFSMGDAYKLPDDGNGTGSLYGLAWSHPNAGGVAGNLNTHGLLAMENGSWLASLTGSTRARDDMRAPIFYDNNNTGYYTDPNSTSNLWDLQIAGSSNKYLYINPGNGYEAMVRYNGGSGSGWYVGKRTSSQVVGTESFHFYSEAAGQTVGGIDTSGNIFARDSMRAPIFYDNNNTGYYADFAGTVSINAQGRIYAGAGVRGGTYGAINSSGFNTNVVGTANASYTGGGSGHPPWGGTINFGAFVNVNGGGLGALWSGNGVTYYGGEPGSVFYGGNGDYTSGGGAGIFAQGGDGGYYAMAGAGIYARGGTNGYWFGVSAYGITRAPAAYFDGNVYIMTPSGSTQCGLNIGYFEYTSNSNSTYVLRANGPGYFSSYIDATQLRDSNNTGYYVDPSSNSFISSLQVQGDITVGQGQGSSNIYFYDSDEGTRRMHCNSNRIGFLNDSNGWGSYCGDGGEWYSDQSVRSPIFYDNNNTGYYTNPDGYSQFSSGQFNNYLSVSRLEFIGVGGNSGVGNQGYSIYQESGGWSSPFPDLAIAYHTGIKIGAYFGYNGTRIYNNNDMGTQIASFGDGDNNFRSYYNIIAYASDERLKENIVNIPNALEKLQQLNGVTFDWKAMVTELGFEPQAWHEVGVLAQQVQAVLPEAVEIAPFDYDWKNPGQSKSGEQYLTVKYEKIVPLLIEAVKDQQKIINDQEARISRLESLIEKFNF